MEKQYLCNKCKKFKNKKDFFKNPRVFKNPKNNRDGLLTVCKECLYKKSKKYIDSHRDNYREYHNNWRKNNIEKARQIKNKYNKTAKGIYNNLKKRENLNISKEDFIKWYDEQEKKCCYCGVSEEQAKQKSHPLNVRLNIERNNPSIGYEKGNISLSCGLCNRVKSDILNADEMKYIGKKFILKKYNNLIK